MLTTVKVAAKWLFNAFGLEIRKKQLAFVGRQLSDTVARMKQYGLAVYDVFGCHYRPLDDALCQLDMFFVQEQGSFRQTHVYATPEQWAAHTRTLENSLTGVANNQR